ncbi:MAG: hypothetical protein GY871_18670 [Actinomycetales bacterium]|nr:hypothetical protein [Actinomycetales bacterium]MCP4893167.1 hypothetical protein [Actinomycetales bacterium]
MKLIRQGVFTTPRYHPGDLWAYRRILLARHECAACPRARATSGVAASYRVLTHTALDPAAEGGSESGSAGA